ncbi:MAG: flagellar motor protein MotB [Desulfovibrio sp.]|nr:flagellar motor protein MotB [Desulfovibrio sp.]|tara:strand:+ start:8054 stop:9118 length:1065 start_codon:yes stop_codon:yes gene_type:complete
MKELKKLLLLTLVVAMTFGFAATTPAQAKMVKKADNFILFLDHSGSMGMTKDGVGDTKIDKAVDVIEALNNAVPEELGFTSAFFTFAPFQVVSEPGTYKKANISKGLDSIERDFEIFNRKTPMGSGQKDMEPVIGGLCGKTALIMFTDGLSNKGEDPVMVAREMRNRFGDNLCLHIVSFADKPAGQKIIDEIRSIFPCTVVADYESLMAPGAMDQYAKDVLYKEVADAKPAPAKPAPVVVPMQKETITFSLNFGFDKAAITDEMVPVLEQAKMILEEEPGTTYEIAGHTDSTGPEAYNQGLSERRAAAVVNWMTANGISADRLEPKGYGENSPKYDNGTKEGRRLNRRVEILSQ